MDPGSGAAIFASTNGGVRWRVSSGTIPNGVVALAGLESATLWAVGDDTIAVSTDGGSTWAAQATFPTASAGSVFRDVACPFTNDP